MTENNSVLRYDMDWLIQQYQAKNKLKYLYFWGHTPKGTGIDKSCFSQWYPTPFEIDGVRYATAEHYMMAQKAKLFGDMDSFDKIIHATHPKQAKDFGRKVIGFNESIWNAHRFNIVAQGSFAKFSQHPELKAFLLGTNQRVLVEASPVDKIWGIGMAQDDDHIDNPLKWRGLNLLGFALMVARDRLLQV